MHRIVRAFPVVGALVGLSISGCSAPPPAAPSSTQPAAEAQAFRNSAHDPPAGWSGPTFKLSRDYPATQPGACPKDVCTWLAVGDAGLFDTDLTAAPPNWSSGNWGNYIQGVLAYVKQGQDPQLANDAGFKVDVGGKTRWFHVPWMAFDVTAGREFVHGTTNERTAHLSDLVGQADIDVGVHTLPNLSADCKTQFPHGFETWSVGMYNEWGGWAIGQAWEKSGRPRQANYLGGTMPAGLPFPEGTVVAKILTTNAPVSCAPFLKGSPEWQVDRHAVGANQSYTCKREVQISRLVQVDIAVVDLRSPTRWVYGTFAYNGNLTGATVWDKLVPMGLQWGADPWTFPAVPRAESMAARQSVLNPGIGIFEHQGCQGRLAGPVDNPQSSCLSCHASAYAPPGGVPVTMGVNSPSSFGFTGTCSNYSLENVSYFQNQTPPQGYPGGNFPNAMSLDTSLQMWVALSQYGQFNTVGQSAACTNVNQF